MIVFASLVFAQTVAAVPAAPAETLFTPVPVAVLEQRLPAISVSLRQTSAGAWACSLSGSSGSRFIDERLCQVTGQCTIRHGSDARKLDDCLQGERRGIVDDYEDALRGNPDLIERLGIL